jgi:hypothetical protein
MENVSNHYVCFWRCGTIGTLCIFSPFIIGLNSDLRDTILYGAVTNHNLRLSQAGTIAAALPMGADLFLDFVWKTRTIDFIERSCVFVSFISTALVYLIVNRTMLDNLPQLFVALNLAKTNIVFSSCLSAVSRNITEKTAVNYLNVSISLYATSCVLKIYHLYYPKSLVIIVLSSILYFITFICVTFVAVYKYGLPLYQRYLKENKANRFKVSISEYTVLLYLLAMFSFVIAVQISNIVCDSAEWINSTGSNLISYDIIQMIFCVIITILPGRIARLSLVIKDEIMSMKRSFVRYISHEIRSPMNVVSAGLDILQAKFNDDNGISEETKELLEDINSSSDIAIEILNDLLHYESMEGKIFFLFSFCY